MKKLINAPENVVKESLEGVAAAHKDLVKVYFDPNFIVRIDAPVQGKVGVISGGGSGHEPMHGGFVGKGMLDAACPGDVFTSPTPDQMEAASKAVDGGAGILHIVKNYTGDVMNFEMAAELCQAEGIEVEAVIIDDDVAVKDSLYTAGRRGVGVTVLAEKICGAAAERGNSLQKVADLCRQVNANGRSMGMALTSCTVPAAGKPTFDIGDDEMEIGIGIHGEPGRQRMPIKTVKDIVTMMAEEIITDLPFKRGDQVITMVNGMGGTPLIELYLVFNEFHEICKEKGIVITRQLVGNYITSLDMAGCSITMLKANDELLELLRRRKNVFLTSSPIVVITSKPRPHVSKAMRCFTPNTNKRIVPMRVVPKGIRNCFCRVFNGVFFQGIC
jgi:dihydroxyacetone kinase-like protein